MNDGNEQTLVLDPYRYLSSSSEVRKLALRLFETVENLPIVSPHGHADPRWFATNEPLGDPTSVLVQVDHYVFRLLYSQGITLEALGIHADGIEPAVSQRQAWRTFAANYHLFRGTPTRLWLDYVFNRVFGLKVRLTEKTADFYFDSIAGQLNTDAFLPNSILERFRIEWLATTEGALDTLQFHQPDKRSGPRVIPTFRPDDVVDADRPDFASNVRDLGLLTGEDTAQWGGYLAALRKRRKFFRSKGATATDHGHPTAWTADFSDNKCQDLLTDCLSGQASREQAEQFRAQLLSELARMSVEDGMVMQLHAGSTRNHNGPLFRKFGPDMGADIPSPTNYVDALRPLLEKYGTEPNLTLILFTLDESTYSRELAPLAGHYPALRLGAPWWFHDSPEGMLRFRRRTSETIGFANLVGFCDDTRSLLSIPARHDMSRRTDARFLAEWILDHRITEDDGYEILRSLSYDIPLSAYKLDNG